MCVSFIHLLTWAMDYFLFCYFQVPDLLLRDCEREIKKVNGSLFHLPLLTPSNRNMCKVCNHLDILLFLLFIRRKILKTLMLVGKSICLGEMEEFRELIWYLLKSLTTWFPYFLSLQTASFNSGTCPWVR